MCPTETVALLEQGHLLGILRVTEVRQQFKPMRCGLAVFLLDRREYR